MIWYNLNKLLNTRISIQDKCSIEVKKLSFWNREKERKKLHYLKKLREKEARKKERKLENDHVL